MALTGIRPPGPLILETNASSNWTAWIRAFEYYAAAVGMSSKTERVQCCLFMHIAGPEAQKVYASMDIQPGNNDKIAPLIEVFKTYCTGRANITVTRFKFNKHNQQGESISTYITELKERIKDCKYGPTEDSLLCDRIVSGVKSTKLQDKLLQTAELDLTKCIDICELSEFNAKQLSEAHEVKEEVEVDYVRAFRKTNEARGASAARGPATPPWRYRENNPPYNTPCGRCGTIHRRDQCPARGKTCSACRKMGHFAKLCKSRPPMQTPVHDVRTTEPEVERELDAEIDELEYDLVIGHVGVTTKRRSRMWYVEFKVAGYNITFKLDTGSEANIIPHDIFNKMKEVQLRKPHLSLITYSGERIRPDGEAELRVGKALLTFQVVSKGCPILGIDACIELGLITKVDMIDTISGETDNNSGTVNTNKTNEKTQKLVSEYSDVFTGLGLIKSNTHIHIDPSVEPCVDPPRRIPYAIQDKVKKELERMIKLGVIVEQTTPTPWVSSITIVKKAECNVCACAY